MHHQFKNKDREMGSREREKTKNWCVPTEDASTTNDAGQYLGMNCYTDVELRYLGVISEHKVHENVQYGTLQHCHTFHASKGTLNITALFISLLWRPDSVDNRLFTDRECCTLLTPPFIR